MLSLSEVLSCSKKGVQQSTLCFVAQNYLKKARHGDIIWNL